MHSSVVSVVSSLSVVGPAVLGGVGVTGDRGAGVCRVEFPHAESADHCLPHAS